MKYRALQPLELSQVFCKFRWAHWSGFEANDAGSVLPPEHPHVKGPRCVQSVVRSASFSGLAALLALAPVSIVSADDSAKKPTSVLDFHVKDIDGKDVDLSTYHGKVLMIVNTASQCGLTPQYKDLEAIYEKYKSQGFEVLAFPANEFGCSGTGQQRSRSRHSARRSIRSVFRFSRRSSSRGKGFIRSTISSRASQPIPSSLARSPGTLPSSS